MTATKTTKPAKDGTSSAYTQGMATESVGADLTPFVYLAEPVGEALISPMPSAGGTVNPDVRATAQTINSATLNASVSLALNNGQGETSYRITGLTASGATLAVETSIDGTTNWDATPGVFPVSGVLVSAITSDGLIKVPTDGRTNVRLRVSIIGSGTITISYTASSVSSAGWLSSPLPAGANLIGSLLQPLANPTSTLTRPASAVSSASVTFTVAAPCVFTWSGNPLVNGQSVAITGGTTPGSFLASPATYFVVGVSGNNFSLATTFGGTGVTSTGSTGTCTIALVYSNNSLIASAAAAGSVSVPFFATPQAALSIAGIRLATNISGTLAGGVYANSGFSNANLAVTLWALTPTYNSGDAGPYSLATGNANFLATFLVSLAQNGDGASGRGILVGGNVAALKFASAQNVNWDLQMVTGTYQPVASQTFTLTVELSS